MKYLCFKKRTHLAWLRSGGTMRFVILIAMATVLLGPRPAWASRAAYGVRFDASWGMETHPTATPPNAHFSPLIGGTHREGGLFWQPGENASPGIEQMAETGARSMLQNEIMSAIDAEQAYTLILGGGTGSPGSTSTLFDMDSEFPLVSLVTMVAPSPDWFVGVNSLEMTDEQGRWRPRVTVDLFAYDAGTDDGQAFVSPDSDSQPPAPIARLGDPFAPNDPALGSFTFDLVRLVGDYNRDLSVDAADYTVFKDTFGMSAPVGFGADGNANGTVDAADYTIWRDNFGSVASSPDAVIASIPEPSSKMLAFVTMCGFAMSPIRRIRGSRILGRTC
ncbi:MAG: spondin domain-containing protein [Pirellulaceae bacterium]|nr:spondin domain-containing protein [Planctomycetales bacterium]